ncbi:hypothetical protein OC835_005170 [Tilletia horrida]|nr:hypothetical protein OC835_005170 [Tilletia horrida]
MADSSPSSSQDGRGPSAVIKSLRLGHFRCQLLDAKRKPMPLYGIQIDGRTISCYVQAEHRQQFIVRIRGNNPDYSHDARLLIAGKDIQGMLLTPDEPDGDFIGRDAEDDTLRPYMFSPLILSDDDRAAIKDEKVLAELGSVELCLKQVLRQKLHRFDLDRGSDPLENCKPVHEKAKIMGGVRFTLGDPFPRPSRKSTDTHFVVHDRNVDPIRFVFRCLTKFGLELNGLLPAASAARKRQEVDDERSELLAKLERIKRRRRDLGADDEDEDEEAARVKLEIKREKRRQRQREREQRRSRASSGEQDEEEEDDGDESMEEIDAETLGLTRPVVGPGTQAEPLNIADSDDEGAADRDDEEAADAEAEVDKEAGQEAEAEAEAEVVEASGPHSEEREEQGKQAEAEDSEEEDALEAVTASEGNDRYSHDHQADDSEEDA